MALTVLDEQPGVDAERLGSTIEHPAHKAGHAHGAVAAREQVHGERGVAMGGEAARYVPDVLIQAEGYENVYDYEGGKQDWIEAGLPTESK